MPPRYAYWTILIDDKPTAFRAREREELLPTLQQLKRTNPNAQMKWFARGQLWDTPQQAQWAQKNLPKQGEKRGREWRPGGQHRDPRARFDKRKKEGGRRPSADRPGAPPSQDARGRDDRRPLPREQKPAGGHRRPTGSKPPWSSAGRHPGGQGFRKPWQKNARGARPDWKREEKAPKRRDESPEKPPSPEQIVIKPKPPERG